MNKKLTAVTVFIILLLALFCFSKANSSIPIRRNSGIVNLKLQEAFFIELVTNEVAHILESPKIAHKALGRYRQKRYIRTHDIRDIVRFTYTAAIYNPAWGDRQTTTFKLLSSWYGESGFDKYAKNTNNNGTADRGICQINSIHTGSYNKFCIDWGLTEKTLQADILYAANLNQEHAWNYTFNNPKRKDQRFYYKTLCKRVRNNLKSVTY